jgi:acetyl esterase/lipase
MHIHGGGWVLNDEKSSDTYLQAIADLCGLTCVSVGYRLAPENPFPAAPHDCFDVAEWLIANAEEVFGARLEFVCGESAGGNLACLVVLHLLHSSEPRNSKFRFKGVLSHYGTHSLQWFAGTKNFKKDPPLVLDEDILNHFRAAYVPNFTQDQITSPQVSPIFADLASFELPPALFTCGSEDCLLEDSISMCIRWMIAGSEAILKIYPGSPHGYIVFPIEAHKNVATALGDVKIFVDSQMSQSQQASL